MVAITDLYEFKEDLGTGHFSKVKRAIPRAPPPHNAAVAIKIIRKPTSGDLQMLLDEINILKSVSHPNIVKLYDVFETGEKIYLVTELMSGGELFDTIVARKHFTEEEARVAARKLLSAIKYLHRKGIAHRDLKPENILMTGTGPNAEMKISDFGLSKMFGEKSNGVMKTACGTPGYIAPEVLHLRGYNNAIDMWSMGVIVYIMLCGFPPFYGNNDAQLFETIKKGEYAFLRPYWDPISYSAKDFVSKLLLVNPEKRMTAEQALLHPWITQTQSKENLFTRQNSRMRELNEAHSHVKTQATASAAPLDGNQTNFKQAMDTIYRVLPSESSESVLEGSDAPTASCTPCTPSVYADARKAMSF